ncbi:AAA family ATPase [Candidatus Micrarchaeota archaeon]|nr:AAA family ATPase [Candidatus Micrarchaeota archaeon]
MQQQAMKEPAQQSMANVRVAAYLDMLQRNQGLWGAMLVFLGALFLISTIPFYPIYIIPVLALLCGAVAYKSPPVGLILGAILAFPAVLYQSSVFGWFYILIMAAILFEAFENWLLVAALEILVLAPFSFGAFPLFGWISIAGMGIGALYFGSRKSVMIAVPSVFLILMLSSMWMLPNSAYLPVKMDLYKAKADLMLTKPAVDLGGMGSAMGASLGRFLSVDNIGKTWDCISWLIGNTITLLVRDSMLLQLIGWAIALYLLGYLPSKLKPRPQLLSSLALLILIPVYFIVGMVYGGGLRVEFIGGVIFAIAVLGGLEHLGVSISREEEIERGEKMKAYGKFGMADMSGGKSEKSLDDVGGYEDVKQELRDAIMMPLQKKDIAFAYGLTAPKGILLFGPPGTGKTMLMRALAKELKYNFIEVRCSQILSQWYGESLPYGEKLVVRDSNGRITRREIGAIVEGKQSVEVLSFDQSGKVTFARIKDWIKHKCSSPIYEVRTRTGRRIRVTDYHSLFALDGTRLESVPTSKLVPGSSYIAIPKRISFPSKPITQIDFLGALEDDDHGLYVKNASRHVADAISRLGRKRVAGVLGYKNPEYLTQILNRGIGVRVKKFVELMNAASIEIRGSDILIGAGSKALPGVMGIDEKLATFIGLWVAEGSYNRQDTVRISTSEREIAGMSELCRGLFGKITVYEKKNGKGRDIYIGSRPLYVLLRHVLGLEDGAGRKKMPEMAFSLGRENLAALLRGYFSGDGSIYENQRGVAMVEGSTTSRELADQLLHLLLYFGIVGTVYGKKEWNGTKSYRVYMTGGKRLTRFKEIGFMDAGKMKRLDASLNRVGWFRDEQMPITGRMKAQIMETLPKWSNSATIGRGFIAEECDDGGAVSENDIYLDRVEEIKRIEDEESVYDVSVEPCQNFAAGFGGVFAHNSEKNVAEVFSNARNNAPTVLFFDELDSIAKKRSTMTESLDTVGPRVLTTILQEMDGASKSDKPVIVIGATNLPNELDSAILRPGRLDKIIYMHLPDPEARKAIIKVSMKKMKLATDVDLDVLAKKTERFSGADLKNMVDEARKVTAKEAITQNKVIPTTMAHFMQVLAGIKPSTSLASLESYEQFRLDFERRTGAAKPKEEEAAKETAVRWQDVAGLDDVKQALLEAIELPLLHEADMKEFKVKPSKGLLLFGPPGTGKTLIVKAAANELKASFQVLSAAEVMKKGYSQAVLVIKEAFNRARENAPGIIFVDEIETFAPARGIGGSAEILGQFLTEMDGVKGKAGVVVIAATNKPALMDPAIMRPGRFDKIFYIPPPDEKGRVAMFNIHLGTFASGVDLKALAAASPGFSGADIAEVCQNAKMKALRTKLAGKPEAVSTGTIMEILKTRRPSITPQILDEYRIFMEAYGERR